MSPVKISFEPSATKTMSGLYCSMYWRILPSDCQPTVVELYQGWTIRRPPAASTFPLIVQPIPSDIESPVRRIVLPASEIGYAPLPSDQTVNEISPPEGRDRAPVRIGPRELFNSRCAPPASKAQGKGLSSAFASTVKSLQLPSPNLIRKRRARSGLKLKSMSCGTQRDARVSTFGNTPAGKSFKTSTVVEVSNPSH